MTGEPYITSPKNAFVFEIAERVARLTSHVKLSRLIASRHATRSGAQDRAAKHIEQLLVAAFAALKKAAVSQPDADVDTIRNLRALKKALDGLHVYLLQYIPRPFEPVELLSFTRQSVSGVAHASDAPVFASEQLYSSCFEEDPVARVAHEVKRIAYRLDHPGSEIGERIGHLNRMPEGEEYKSPGYICIPRADLNNPCSWPSLMHELHHQVSGVTSESLRNELKNQIGKNAYDTLLHSCFTWMAPQAIPVGKLETYLGQWLLECWCDCAGINVLGPSIWFSQLHAFFHTLNNYLETPTPSAPEQGVSYPPAFFRLRVLRTILENRYEFVDNEVKRSLFSVIDQARNSLFAACGPILKPNSNPAAAHLHSVFSTFLYSKLSGTKKVTENISFDDLERLVKALDDGEPIPTVGPDPLSDRPASIGEILLAGWMSRLGAHQQKIIAKLQEATSSKEEELRDLQKIVDRFDESLKRSIQVVEWVQLFREKAPEVQPSSLLKFDAQAHSEAHAVSPAMLLSKTQIIEKLKSNKLRIVPLINAELQLSSTAVDIRLGHNFEVFFPDTRGVIDSVAGRDFENDVSPESMDVQIDFMDGISIHPGQFILAHTLEYIRLPSDVAAQIEGRSSFARLGLQIHMTANLVEAGFEGSLTLEIANVGPTAIKLYPGMRIGQLRFFALQDAPTVKRGAAKYHGLLSHNKTRQNIDPEVDILKKNRPKPSQEASV